MRSFITDGIVVKRRDFGEADRLLTILTPKFGKIQIKAIGVRKITSKRSPHVELLNHSIFTIHKGKTLSILTEAQTICSYSNIKDDLTRIGFAYHLCELIDGLCAEGQVHEDVYDLFKAAIFKLSEGEELVETVSEFEIQLLTLLGFYSADRNSNLNTTLFIEDILERRLKTKSLLFHFR